MSDLRKRRLMSAGLVALSVFVAVVAGGGAGVAIAETDNLPQSWHIGNSQLTLPTEILDRSGQLIDQFNGVQHHQHISIYKLPKYVIWALLTREDKNFFHQSAFSVRGTLRAAVNDLTGRYFSGGSTITQQLAGTLYANRDHITIRRKLKELWYALQVEKRLTKWQVLQMYLNMVYFGRNCYGIDAASELYFGHPASQLTLAQAVALIIQLADPAGLDWINHPHRAKKIQRVVLNEMVAEGYITQARADQSFRQFWENYPYARAQSAQAHSDFHSKAPYFTSYVRSQLQQDLYGRLGFLRDGLVVHTTLNLKYQNDASRIMRHYIYKYNQVYQRNMQTIFSDVKTHLLPDVNVLGLIFDLPRIERASAHRQEQGALAEYLARLNPDVNALSLVFGMPHLAAFTAMAHQFRHQQQQKTTVEGALITLSDHSGEILAMQGGYSWKRSQFNRAVNARLQEGSSIKPMYYSVAISEKKLTVASPLYDGPVVFWNPDGTPYTPRDFLGQWQGLVSVRWALQDSINVPSLEILQKDGFKAAINRISAMMGLSKYKDNPGYFPHLYPLGLGIVPVAPINMARAYATFANQGRLVTPIAITYVTDRQNGQVVLQPLKALREKQLREGTKLQIMTPQVAYIMTNLLESVVTAGDLWQTYFDVGGWNGMPMAGKTGTTENWDDAWTVGFSPYYTTAVWFGFDRHGSSLGLGLTGATGAGPVWAHYMKAIDTGHPAIPFPEPKTGLVHAVVDCYSGLLPTKYSTCTKREIFLKGTAPTKFDTLGKYRYLRTKRVVQKLENSALVQSLSSTPPSRAGSFASNVAASYRPGAQPWAGPTPALGGHGGSGGGSPVSQPPLVASAETGRSTGTASSGGYGSAGVGGSPGAATTANSTYSSLLN